MPKYVYRFEVRGDGRPEFTDRETIAFQAAFRMAEENVVVTIIDNDARHPVVARVFNGFVQILQ